MRSNLIFEGYVLIEIVSSKKGYLIMVLGYCTRFNDKENSLFIKSRLIKACRLVEIPKIIEFSMSWTDCSVFYNIETWSKVNSEDESRKKPAINNISISEFYFAGL